MKFKEGWKRFWTLNRHHAEGFTLVELIVVIAILAILAGVGTAGYSGYITNANKNADKMLVGNIIRAVETGHNSYAFKLNDVLQAASNQGIQVPVGFVVLTRDGCTAIQSSGESASMTGNPCELVENVTIYSTATKVEREVGSGCDKEDETAFELSGESTASFCKTHSNVPFYENAKVFTTADPSDLTVTTKTFYHVSDPNALVTNHTAGDIITNMPVYGSSVVNDTDSIITKSLIAAFGEDYKRSMVLKYDSWTNTEVPSFFADAPTIWGEMKDMAKDATSTAKPFLDQKYDSSELLISDYTTYIATTVTEDKFVEEWTKIFNGNNPNATLCADGTQDAFYFAGRTMWNRFLADYVETHSTCGHANDIRNYGDGINLGILNAKVPKAVVFDSFDKAFDGNMWTYGPIGCDECQTVAGEYVSSGAAAADARALYQTFQTIDATSTGGVINGDTYGEIDFFSYYESYMNEFATLYGAVDEIEGENKIIITFYYQPDGTLTYTVSNPEADPRNG